MAIPTLDLPSVSPTISPLAALSESSGPNATEIQAQQSANLSDAVNKVSQQQADIQIDATQQANDVRVQDALNQAKEAQLKLTYDPQMGYTNIKGIDALQRDSGQPLATEYGSKFQDAVNGISDKLGNDVQRQLFAQHTANMKVGFEGDLLHHESEQFQNYTLSVRDATIKNAQDSIALNYSNPALTQSSVEAIRASAFDRAKLQGKSATEAEMLAKDEASKGHLLAIGAALQDNNPVAADQYLKSNSSDMMADDILKARGPLKSQLDAQLALTTATGIMNKASLQLDAPPLDRAFNIALGNESGGKQYGGAGSVAGANAPTTSPAGAVGAAQIMPDTGPEAAKLAGLPWDEIRFKTDAEYNKTLGKAYFSKQLQDNGGDLAKAYAAYNAGPGALKIALKNADPATGNWMAQLPKETQDYVQKNMAAFNNGGGKPQVPNLFDLENQVRQTLGTSDPTQLKNTLGEVKRQYDEFTAAIKTRDEANEANAYRALLSNGGNYNSLPVDITSNIPPDKVPAVMEYAGKIYAGEDKTNLTVYSRLAENYGQLSTMSDDAFMNLKPYLSTSDFKHFAEQRAALMSGQSTNAPGDLNTGAVKLALDEELRMRGINPGPKDNSGWGGESNDAIRIGAIRKFVNDSILGEQTRVGHKLSDQEISGQINYLFSRNVSNPGWFGYSGPAIQMKPGDIPSKTRDALKQAFKARGVPAPSDGDMLSAYWRGLTQSNNKQGQ